MVWWVGTPRCGWPSPEVSTRRAATGLFALAVTAFVMLGLADGGLGVAWPSIRTAMDRDLSDLGLLLASGGIGYLVASTGYGRLHSRLGAGPSLALGSTLMTVGLLGYAFAGVWGVMVGSAILMGSGGGIVDSGINAHAALEFDVRGINLVHAAYGVGATLGPLAMTASVTFGGNWRGGYVGFAVAQLAVAVLVWRSRQRWVSRVEEHGGAPTRSRRMTRLLLVAVFLVYSGAEVATGQWSFTLLSEGRGMSAAEAGWWVAAYWGGLTAGRFLFGGIGHRVNPSRLLDGSVLVALAGLVFLWADPWGAGHLGLPVAGLGFAAVFPTMVALTPARIGRDRSTGMMGYQLAAANLGVSTIPWAVGLVAGAYGLAALAPALVAATVALGALHLVTDRLAPTVP